MNYVTRDITHIVNIINIEIYPIRNTHIEYNVPDL